jgi:DNA helicase HerA-like ATPase
MGTDECLHKLAPVMPERVRQWRRSLEVADATTRRLLEQHIASVAYQRLGDPDGLFLSLPPPERARGAYHLGTIRYDGPTWPLGLREEEVLQHVAIFGRSGAGKTNVLFHLLEQLTGRRVPFVFLDWKRTGRHLLPRLRRRVHVYTPRRDLSPFPFNPFLAPPGLDVNVYAHPVVSGCFGGHLPQSRH